MDHYNLAQRLSTEKKIVLMFTNQRYGVFVFTNFLKKYGILGFQFRMYVLHASKVVVVFE